MTAPSTPREVHLDRRKLARDGQTVYNGDKFPISFTREEQDRIEKLAHAWRVPRSEMVRYLVASALDEVEAMPIPTDDQEQEQNE